MMISIVLKHQRYRIKVPVIFRGTEPQDVNNNVISVNVLK